MYKTIEDFKKDWTDESKATIKVFQNLSDDSLKTKVYPEGRDLGFLAWHISQTIGEMIGSAGLHIEGFDESMPAPTEVKQIIEKYEYFSEQLMKNIDQWSDDMLNDELNMYGQTWKRAEVLKGLVYHQIHHRGQITILMRQAGLLVPGVYGPSKEEWSQYGMPVQD